MTITPDHRFDSRPARSPAALQALCAAVSFHPGVTRRERGRCWARVRAVLRQRSLVLAQRRGLCMVLAVGHRLGDEDLRLVAATLLDQPPTRHITLNRPADVAWYLSDDVELPAEPLFNEAWSGLDPDEAALRRHTQPPSEARDQVRQVLVRACLGYSYTVEAARLKLREATRG